MTDKLDELLDAAISAEKAHALERFRLHPLSLSRTTAAATSGLWPLLRNFALSSAALALLVLGVVLFVRFHQPNSQIEIATVQRALLKAKSSSQNSALAPRENRSDMAWTVQRAIVRVQCLGYPQGDLDNTVLAALSKVQNPPRQSVALDFASPAELDERIKRLASEGTLERALQVANVAR